jgi:S-adenosylmethionine hydrolase
MKMITLTSDLGLNDHYVAAMKGRIYSMDSDAKIIDISHNVKPFDTAHAAFLLQSCFESFPKGSVHIVAIDTEPIINYNELDGSFPCILEYKEHFFIANDNGFFGAFLGVEAPTKLWRLDDVLSNPNNLKFPSKNIFVPAAIEILKGTDISSFALEQSIFKRALLMQAVLEDNLIKGQVVYLDSYGNVITNISKELFATVGKSNPFTIMFRKAEYYIDHISESYNEVMPGERLAMFNENNLLEIAINRGANGSTGGAEKLIGMRKGDTVRIEFTPQGSRETLSELF